MNANFFVQGEGDEIEIKESKKPGENDGPLKVTKKDTKQAASFIKKEPK
jgi:hypothetical protein